MRGHHKATFVRLFITFPRDNFLPPPSQTLRRLPMAKKVVNGCLGDEELLRTVNTVKNFLVLSVLTVYWIMQWNLIHFETQKNKGHLPKQLRSLCVQSERESFINLCNIVNWSELLGTRHDSLPYRTTTIHRKEFNSHFILGDAVFALVRTDTYDDEALKI